MTALREWSVATDAELVRAAVSGDRPAFAEIYDRYGDRLHDFCIGIVRNRDVAADCVQDVFCVAATRLSQLNNPDSLRPWLYAIANREALRQIHRSGRERAVEDLPDEPSTEAGPDALAVRNELAELIEQAAGGLSDRDRAVLDLSYRHGLDGVELAQAMGVSSSSAKKMTQRLRETVERSLGALLVSRSAAANADGCPDLRVILEGWDGRLNVLLRKRIARHIESCPVCDDERRRLVNPVALLGGAPVFLSAPDWLRARTLDAATPTGTGHATPERSATSRKLLRGGVVAAAALLAVLGAFAAGRYERHATVDPVDVTRSVPQRSAVSPTSAARQPRLEPRGPSAAERSTQPPSAAMTSSSAAPPSAESTAVTPASATSSTHSRPPALPPLPPSPPSPPAQPSPPVVTHKPVPPVVPPPVSVTPIKPTMPVKVRPPIVPVKPAPVMTMPPVIQ